jgi:hypothetical protein
MEIMPRVLVLLLSVAIGTVHFACRENPADIEFPPTIDGIDGIVNDRFRNPLPNVQIRVYFDYQIESFESEPIRSITVASEGLPVTVIVTTTQMNVRRILYTGTPPVGEFFVSWDGRDSSGVRMRSGVYLVRYLVHDTSAGEYVQAVDGGVLTRTDSIGYYRIGREELPLNYSPVPLYSTSGTAFYGNYRIGRTVGLLFDTPYTQYYGETTLFEGMGSRLDVILE